MNDLRYAFRRLIKNPGFTLVAVLTPALGIGAGTSVFSIFSAIVLRSLPVPNPHELRVLRWSGSDSRVPSLVGNTKDIGNHRIADRVSPPVFSSLGVNPMMGRVFGAGKNRRRVIGT